MDWSNIFLSAAKFRLLVCTDSLEPMYLLISEILCENLRRNSLWEGIKSGSPLSQIYAVIATTIYIIILLSLLLLYFKLICHYFRTLAFLKVKTLFGLNSPLQSFNKAYRAFTQSHPIIWDKTDHGETQTAPATLTFNTLYWLFSTVCEYNPIMYSWFSDKKKSSKTS